MSFVPFVVVFHRVHWLQVVGLFGAQDLPECLRWSSGGVFPPFARFTALLLSGRLQIWLYFAFLGVFSAFCGVCVGLCCLGALRGLWGFVRVWS